MITPVNPKVEHPTYYNSTRMECIEMLDRICEGYSGVAAFDIGQCKYLNRAGLKAEEGYSKYEKGLEDLNKFRFYLNDFFQRACRKYYEEQGEVVDSAIARSEVNIELPEGFYCRKTSSKLEKRLVAMQFAAGRSRETREEAILCDHFEDVIRSIWCMRTFMDLRFAIDNLNSLIKFFEENFPKG